MHWSTAGGIAAAPCTPHATPLLPPPLCDAVFAVVMMVMVWVVLLVVLVVLGLATFAGLLASTVGLTPIVWLMVVAAVTAWVGSILMYADRRRSGLVCCGLAAICGGVATIVVGDPATAASVSRLLSGCLIGLTVNAMLLGHWYLNAPGMQVDALRRSIDQTLLVWALLLAFTLAAVGCQFTTTGSDEAGWLSRFGTAMAAASGTRSDGLDQTGLALLWLRWLAPSGLSLYKSMENEKIPEPASAEQ